METKTAATDAKKANDKTLGVDSQKQVDVNTSVAAMLDPADHSVVERDDMAIEGVKPGSSYPTAEAVQREADAKDGFVDEEARKLSGHVVTRSALDHGQESIVHPGAKSADEKPKK